jgi:hypothetical protein
MLETPPGAMPTGQTYQVTVIENPYSQYCSVTNGAGTVGTTPVTTIQVECVSESLTATQIARQCTVRNDQHTDARAVGPGRGAGDSKRGTHDRASSRTAPTRHTT